LSPYLFILDLDELIEHTKDQDICACFCIQYSLSWRVERRKMKR